MKRMFYLQEYICNIKDKRKYNLRLHLSVFLQTENQKQGTWWRVSNELFEEQILLHRLQEKVSISQF